MPAVQPGRRCVRTICGTAAAESEPAARPAGLKPASPPHPAAEPFGKWIVATFGQTPYAGQPSRSGGTGRRAGFKIRFPSKEVWVRVPPSALKTQDANGRPAPPRLLLPLAPGEVFVPVVQMSCGRGACLHREAGQACDCGMGLTGRPARVVGWVAGFEPACPRRSRDVAWHPVGTQPLHISKSLQAAPGVESSATFGWGFAPLRPQPRIPGI